MIIEQNGWKLDPKERRIAIAILALVCVCFIGYMANKDWARLDQFGQTTPTQQKRLR